MPISIVIPVLNEEENLARCLSSLLPQLQHGDEILIVDNGSTDHTLEIASQYKCKILLCPDSSLGDARSFGVNQASNEIILDVDGDFTFSEHFLDGHRRYYEQNPNIIGVRGKILDPKGRALANLTYGIATNLLQMGHAGYSYRKSVYLQTDGHRDISFGEDVLFWNEITKLGMTVYDPNLIVYHYDDDKYVQVPSYLIGASLLGVGAGYEGMIGGAVGMATMGLGGGFLAGQAGVDMLKKIPGVQEYWSNPNHLHHYHIGLMIIAATMAFSDVLSDDIEAGLYGLGAGLSLHDLLTEPTVEPTV